MSRTPRTTARWAALVAAGSLLVSACGTQVDDSLRQQAQSAALSGRVASGTTGETAVLPGDPAAPGAPVADGAVTGADPAAPGAVPGADPAAPAAPGADPGAPAAPGGPAAPAAPGGPAAPAAPAGGGSDTAALPAGGNGGATDVGVTADQILIGNVSDLSGPQPGLFQTAINGTSAYIAKVNAEGGVFGRKLKLAFADSQTSCEGHRSAQQKLVGDVFAFAGSFSLFDQCGATVLKSNPKVPDSHLAVTKDANALPNNFSVNPVGDTVNNGLYAWAAEKFGKDVVENAAFMYVNLPAVTNVASLQKKSAESTGWKFTYERAVGATETDFTADILQLKQRGVKMFLTLFNADQMANFKPQADRQDFRPTYLASLMYDQTFFTKLGGPAAAEGIYGSSGSALFFSPEDAAAIPAVAEFQKYYEQVSGGAAADTFAASGWAQTHLLVEAIKKAGPQLTRDKVLAALRATTSFDAGGFYAPGNPGQKKAGNCYVVWQIRGGKYVRTDTPAKGYRCDGRQA